MSEFQFRLELPVRKGTDVYPDVPTMPPVVRTFVHLRQKYNSAGITELLRVAEELMQDQRATIINFCSSQQSNHRAGITDFSAKRREIRFGDVAYMAFGNQEQIVVNLYPEKVVDEDMPCLMIVYDRVKIAAIPMSQIDDPNLTPSQWTPIYRYSAIQNYTAVADDSAKAILCQYKFGGEHSVIYGQVRVWTERELPDYGNNIVVGGVTSVTTNKFRKFVTATPDPYCRVNGDGSTFYTNYETFTVDANGRVSDAIDRGGQSNSNFVYSDGSRDYGGAVGDGTYPDVVGPDPEWYHVGGLNVRTPGFPWYIGDVPGYPGTEPDYATLTPVTYKYSWWNTESTSEINVLTIDNTLATGAVPVTTHDSDGTINVQTQVFSQLAGVDVLGTRTETIAYSSTMYTRTSWSGPGHTPEITTTEFRGYTMSFTSDGITLPDNAGVGGIEGATYISDGVAHRGGLTFAPNFPPNLSTGNWTVHWGLYDNSVVSGNYTNTIVSMPDAEVETPYGVFAGGNALTGWLHVSNGEHFIQGFQVTGDIEPALEGYHLWLDGSRDLTASLPQLLGTEMRYIHGLLMDIPLRRIKELWIAV